VVTWLVRGCIFFCFRFFVASPSRFVCKHESRINSSTASMSMSSSEVCVLLSGSLGCSDGNQTSFSRVSIPQLVVLIQRNALRLTTIATAITAAIVTAGN